MLIPLSNKQIEDIYNALYEARPIYNETFETFKKYCEDNGIEFEKHSFDYFIKDDEHPYKLLNDKIFVYILIFVVSFFVPDIYHIDLYKFMFPYFVIGYMYKKYDLQEKLKAIYNSDCFICVIGIVFILLFCLFERDSYIYVSGHSIVGKDFVNQLFVDFYRYITGLTGSVFTLLLLIKIYNFCTQKKILKENNVILTIGKNTMGIYNIWFYQYNYLGEGW